MKSLRTLTAALGVFLLSVVTSSCTESPTAVVPSSEGLEVASLDAAVQQDLAPLRRLTAPFHNFNTAERAGWGTQITSCLEIASGAQGRHYGNLAFIDGDARVLEPELLLYEPQKNGRLRLVALEYIVPFDFVSSTAEPPELLGQKFHQNFDFNVWALHVWLWRHNPDGLFADWNPKVSCAFED